MPTYTPTPALGFGSTLVREKDGMEMAYIPAGEFEMGVRMEKRIKVRCTQYIWMHIGSISMK
jgi:hypothetical protein